MFIPSMKILLCCVGCLFIQILMTEEFWYVNSSRNGSQMATYEQFIRTLSNIQLLWIRAKFANV